MTFSNLAGGVANEGSSYEDRRVMTPAYRRKYGQKKMPVQNKLPINDGTQPIMNHNGPIFLTSGGRPAEDEIQERFHTDRERNLKSFFTDHSLNDGGSRNEFRGKFRFKITKNFANRKNVTLKLQIYEKTTEKHHFSPSVQLFKNR